MRAGDGVEDLRSALDSMTVDDVNDALRRHLTGGDLRAILVCADADSLRELLLERGADADRGLHRAGRSDAVLEKDREIAALPLGVRKVEIVPASEIFR